MTPDKDQQPDPMPVPRRPGGMGGFGGRPFDPRLLEGPIPRSLFLLAFPIMGGNILQIAYQLVDAFWVGRLGAAAVASVSVSMPLMFLMMSIGMGFTIAGSTLIAQYVGARNPQMVDQRRGVSVWDRITHPGRI